MARVPKDAAETTMRKIPRRRFMGSIVSREI
jgi:hypothetical protein